MGLFSRKSDARPPLVPALVLTQLGAFGQASLESRRRGTSVVDPRFGWDNFFSGAMLAMQTNTHQAIVEIRQAAGSDPMAMFGGSRVVAEYDGGLDDDRYLEMVDAGLTLMRDHGLSSAHLTGYESMRWIAEHGDLGSF